MRAALPSLLCQSSTLSNSKIIRKGQRGGACVEPRLQCSVDGFWQEYNLLGWLGFVKNLFMCICHKEKFAFGTSVIMFLLSILEPASSGHLRNCSSTSVLGLFFSPVGLCFSYVIHRPTGKCHEGEIALWQPLLWLSITWININFTGENVVGLNTQRIPSTLTLLCGYPNLLGCFSSSWIHGAIWRRQESLTLFSMTTPEHTLSL